jgi:hypothetical protein
VEFPNSTNIPPGCTAKVSQLLSAMRELEFTGYRQSDGVIIPFSGGMVKRHSFLRSVVVVTERWWDEVMVPRSTSIVACFKDQAQVAGNALGTLDADIVRWWGGVLQPRSSSIAARFRALHGIASMRLEINKRAQHWDEVAAGAWRSVNAELVRWWDEVLLPRSRSIAARTKTLHENGWLRLADTKQREHRAQLERQAWESVDAEIMRWWNEVLLPRSRSIAARTRTLYESGWLRSADAKQRREHRAQVERQAWESVDAEIMRWWDEVLLPRSRSLAARTKETLCVAKWVRVATEIQRRVESYRTRKS